MNKIINRYMFKTLSFGLLMSVLLFLSLDVLFNLIKELNDISSTYTIGDVFFFVMLTVPSKIYELFPVSAVVAVVVSLGALAAGSELVVLRASGVSKLKIARIAVMTISFWLIFVVLIGEYVSPAGEQMAQAFRTQEISAGKGASSASSIWLKDGDVIFNARKMAKVAGTDRYQMDEVTVFELDEKKVAKVSKAEKATYDDDTWLLENLQVSNFNNNGVTTEHIQSLAWGSRIEPEILNISTTRPKYLSIRDLQKLQKFSGKNSQLQSAYQIAWWSKYTYPLLVIATALTGVIFLFGQIRSGGFAQRLVTGVVLGIVIYLMNKTLLNVGEVYHIHPGIITLIPSLVIISVSLMILSGLIRTR